MDYNLTNELNRLLDQYFLEFLSGNRSLYELMPDIYDIVKFEFESELINTMNYENTTLIDSFKKNIQEWSLARNYRQAKDLTDFISNNKDLTDDMINDFLSKNKSKYNKNWLDSEFKYMQNSINSVNQWNSLPQDSLVQFRTSGDEKVRASHAELDGITLQQNDPAWSYLMPPLEFNCRCSIIPVYNETITDKKDLKNLTTDIDTKKKNPINTGEIFPSDETYLKGFDKIKKKLII